MGRAKKWTDAEKARTVLEGLRRERKNTSLERKLSGDETLVGKLVHQLDLYEKFFPGES